MPELITISAAELAELNGRLTRLAREKAQLQLIALLVNRVSELPGLEKTVEGMLRFAVDILGGLNATIFYRLDDAIHCVDVLGRNEIVAEIDDDLVRQVFETHEFVSTEQEFHQTGMMTKEFTKATTWVMPLLVRSELVGVLRMDRLLVAGRELRDEVETFLRYASLMLKNEISGETRLRRAFDAVSRANRELVHEAAVRKEAEETLRTLYAELEERVRERTSSLEEANRELEAFSYSVSHELRSPLRAIDGFSARIAGGYEGLLDDEGRRLFERVRWNAQRMGRLIDDLLAFSQAGRTDLAFRTVDMTTSAKAAFTRVAPDPVSRSRIYFSVGDLPEARGDADLLRRVWENLLSNAIKFSAEREKPEIFVEGNVVEGEALYRVRDNGVGFDQKYAGKLFGVFQRLHGMYEFEGTGVGLALVRRIVLRHGGRVWAEGAVGEGATFTFTVGPGPNGTGDDRSSSPASARLR